MKLLEKMRQQKLLSMTLVLFTLSIGIVIGTLVNTGVHAQRSGSAAPDATPLVLPKAAQIGNEFTKLAKMLEPSVVNITADYTPKLQEGKNRRERPRRRRRRRRFQQRPVPAVLWRPRRRFSAVAAPRTIRHRVRGG